MKQFKLMSLILLFSLLPSGLVRAGAAEVEEQKVEITSPKHDSEVELISSVTGNISDPKFHVYVFVHPFRTNLWWVQPTPSLPSKAGSWQSLAYFGTKEGKGIGGYFEILAIVAPEEALFQEREQYGTEEMMQIMKQYSHSINQVKRVR
jgi:hypothetical protein